MDEKSLMWYNGTRIYFKILNNINNLCEKLKENSSNFDEIENYFLQLSSELLRIFPYKIKHDPKDNSKIIDIYLGKNDGILQLKEFFPNLENEYEKILKKYSEDLKQIPKIRNKYVHEPHNIICVEFELSGNHKEAIFKYKDNDYILNTDLLLKIINEINRIFKNIGDEIDLRAKDLNEEEKKYIYRVWR